LGGVEFGGIAGKVLIGEDLANICAQNSGNIYPKYCIYCG